MAQEEAAHEERFSDAARHQQEARALSEQAAAIRTKLADRGELFFVLLNIALRSKLT
jgi:hypothetical protein